MEETLPESEGPHSAPKVKIAKTVDEAKALNIPVISPIRSTNFEFQLFKSNNSRRSELTDDAKRNLYEDALYLEAEVVRERLHRVRLGTRGNLGNGRLKCDMKRIASHYQVSVLTVSRIIKKGNTHVSTQSRKRPGRKKKLTPSKVNQNYLW